MELVTCNSSECDNNTFDRPAEASHTLVLDSSKPDEEFRFSSTLEFNDHHHNVIIPRPLNEIYFQTPLHLDNSQPNENMKFSSNLEFNDHHHNVISPMPLSGINCQTPPHLDNSQPDEEIKFSSSPKFNDHAQNIIIPRASLSGMSCRIPLNLSKIGRSIQLSDYAQCIYCDVVVRRFNFERHELSLTHIAKKQRCEETIKLLNYKRHSKRKVQSSNSKTKRQKVADVSATRSTSEVQEAHVKQHDSSVERFEDTSTLTNYKELLKDVSPPPTDTKKQVKDADTQTCLGMCQVDASAQTYSEMCQVDAITQTTCNQAEDFCKDHQQYVKETTPNNELENFQKNVIAQLFTLRNRFIEVVTQRHRAVRSEYREALAKLNTNYKREMEHYHQAAEDHVKDVEILHDIVLYSDSVLKPPQ